MGTWGANAFDNDAALDWLAELEGQGVSALRSLLDRVVNTAENDWLDVDLGAAAIAAAEIVVAARGGRRDRLPNKGVLWLEANGRDVVEADRHLAVRAVKRVLAENSELASLWDEVDIDSPWLAGVRRLLANLGEDATQKVEREGGDAEPAPLTEALLSFCSLRGLEPTEKELAQILAERDTAEINGGSRVRRVHRRLQPF